jgi:hypothetical protein
VQPSQGLWRWIAPHFAIVFFLIQLFVGLQKAGVSLSDPGTGWHLTAGRLMLETGAVPHQDVFSFTANGKPWLDSYWLFEVIAAWLVRLGGLPLYGAACVVIYALVPALLYARMLRTGANPLAAFLVMPLAQLVLRSHAMARPHVVTYVFLVLVLNGIDDARRGNWSFRRLLWMPALTALWCNLHGGFLAAIALTGVAAATTALRWLVKRDDADRRAAIVLAGLTIAMTAATALNPYGLRLLPTVAEQLRMTFTQYFVDFQAPPFHAADAAVTAFEVLVIALMAVMALGPMRFDVVDVALALLTLHWALAAQRNMNVFVLVAAPMLARGLTPLLAAAAPDLARRWDAIGTAQRGLRSAALYVPLVSAIVLAAAARGCLGFPTSLEGLQLTAGAARVIAADLPRYARAFNHDGLGGSLIDRFWPGLHVFVDDRGFVYGDRFMVDDYLTVLYARPGWQRVLDRWQVTAAILIPDASPCLGAFQASPAWRVSYEDAQNVLFVRTSD